MPQFAANLTLLFSEVPFLDRFQRAAEEGFRGVEYLFPYAWPKQELAARLQDLGLVQVLHNLPPGDWDAGERGIACHPHRVEEFRRGLDQAIDYAQTLGCRQLNCLAGLKPSGFEDAEIWETLVSNLAYASQQLKAAGICLLVEAINSRVDMPGFYLDTTAKALAAIRDAGGDNLGYQFDLYHMHIMEAEQADWQLAETLQRHLPQIRHIQIADSPGRHEPGTGEIDFQSLFERLDKLGYNGWVSCEYRPLGDTREGLEWLRQLRRTGLAT